MKRMITVEVVEPEDPEDGWLVTSDDLVEAWGLQSGPEADDMVRDLLAETSPQLAEAVEFDSYDVIFSAYLASRGLAEGLAAFLRQPDAGATELLMSLDAVASMPQDQVRSENLKKPALGRNPAWDVHEGDILALRRPDGRELHIGISQVWPPDEVYDYRRVVGLTVDGSDVPTAVDLRAGEDSAMTVGDLAEPFGLAALRGDVLSLLTRDPEEMITPGLFVLVPGQEGSQHEPDEAGFRRVGSGFLRPPDGYAIILDWSSLAQRLQQLP